MFSWIRSFPAGLVGLTVPSCNCKDIFPSDPQNCNYNGN